MNQPWSIDKLRKRAERLPRVSLTYLPTPLQECPRFSEALGNDVRVLLKRDDLTGVGFGGNKLRKLEFSMGEAQASGCDVLVHGLAGQSNYCRQAAAAAAKVGMPCYLVLKKDHKAEDPPQSNRLLDYIFGAHVRMVESREQGPAKAALVEELKSQGHKPYVIGRHDEVVGAIAYSLCLAEIIEQSAQTGAEIDYVCVTGCGGTLGGLVLGKRLLGLDGRVLGFQPAPGPSGDELRRPTAEIATDAVALLGADEKFTVDDIDNTAQYGGKAYGTPTDECIDAMLLLGRTEGLTVGPVYTAKGLSGMIDCIRTGKIAPGSTVVFVHTGGTTEPFAYNAEIFKRVQEVG